ncbi:hypothetical protein P154DRAFT_304574 [Amniculicola lignicola CBS 123094]|uniref:Uncharacterized protein n=1 Tax=Amniculicola lignicola CBS 123094 TaxID=1392246 RepID=A0A6A5W9M1_9PLEO|nr:hypothetical protein P154DRAFT_304574 [Amniculicola lignicola CBS 123094]
MEKVERKFKTFFHRKSKSAASNTLSSPRQSYEPQTSHPASPRSQQHVQRNVQSPREQYQVQTVKGETTSSQASPQSQRHARKHSLTSPSESSSIPHKTGRNGSIASPGTNTIGEDVPQHDFQSSPPTSGDEDSTIADNYRAYNQYVASPASSKDPHYMSLGEDARLVQKSTERHNEDVTARNINKFPNPESSVGSWHGSLKTNRFEPMSDTTQPGVMNSDNIFPHIEDPNAAPHAYNKADWPSRLARDESNNGETFSDAGIRKKTRSSNRGQALQDFLNDGPPNTDGSTDVVAEYSRKRKLQEQLKGVVNLENSEDADLHTRVAPAVTHETIKPVEHEITTEVIYREIHNHDVYHLIQPVYETEILPTRHYIPDPQNPSQLIEVPESSLPDCTGGHQRWQITPTPTPVHPNPKQQVDIGRDAVREKLMYTSFPAFASAGLKEPKIIDEKRYMSPQGFERIETTWLHPPTLEKMEGYIGPVMPIQFVHHGPTERKPLHGEKRSDGGVKGE